jgi:hypothetical protein
MICSWDQFRTTDDRIQSSSVNHNSGRSVWWRNGDLKSQHAGHCCCRVQPWTDGKAWCLTLSLPEHSSRNVYNDLGGYNTGRSLSSTPALERSLSLKTNRPKIVMGSLEWTNVPSLIPPSPKSIAQPGYRAVHPLRARQVFCSVVWNIAWYSEGPDSLFPTVVRGLILWSFDGKTRLHALVQFSHSACTFPRAWIRLVIIFVATKVDTG